MPLSRPHLLPLRPTFPTNWSDGFEWTSNASQARAFPGISIIISVSRMGWI